MNELEAEATKSAKIGECEASVYYTIFYEGYWNGEYKKEGPLGDCLKDFDYKTWKAKELSEILLNMIQEYISDNNIKFILENIDEHINSSQYRRSHILKAIVRW